MHSPQTPSRIAPHGAQRTSPHQIPLKCYSHVGKIHALPSPHLSTQPVISFKHPDSTFLASTVDHVLHSQTLPVPEDPTRSVPLENTPVDLPTSPTFQIPHFPSPSLLLPTMSFQAMQASMSVTSISSTVSTIGSPLVRDFEPDDLPDLCSVPELSLYSDTDSSVHPGSLESSPKREDFWDLDHAISSCCTTPATSFTPSPISASSQMSLISPRSQDDYTVASSWQSVEDVGEMLSQLEKVACELRMMDSQEDTKNPSNVFPSFLGEERCLPHSAGDVYSSSDASQTHSLAYLQDDSSSFCCGEEDPVEEDSLHPDVPRIMITVPSTENLLESNDSSQDCEEFGRLLKGLKKSVVWLSPESARDISRLDLYSKREVSHTPRTSSLRLPPHAYSPPSQLLPFPCLPPIVISSLEPSNDSYVPPVSFTLALQSSSPVSICHRRRYRPRLLPQRIVYPHYPMSHWGNLNIPPPPFTLLCGCVNSYQSPSFIVPRNV